MLLARSLKLEISWKRVAGLTPQQCMETTLDAYLETYWL